MASLSDDDQEMDVKESVLECTETNSINIQDGDGNTKLFVSATEGNLIEVDALLAAKADPDIQSKHGNTALIQASWRGYTKVVTTLIRAKADMEVFNSVSNKTQKSTNDESDTK